MPSRCSARAESVYRLVADYRAGHLDLGLVVATEAETVVPRRNRASFKRSLLCLVKHAPAAFGWCRTRSSCATLALELQTRRGVSVSQDTIRRWLHELGDVWTRARHGARDDDPERVTKLARIRSIIEGLLPSEALFFAAELAIHLLAKIGYAWTPQGTHVEVMTPGTNRKHYLAGALNYPTGRMVHVV